MTSEPATMPRVGDAVEFVVLDGEAVVYDTERAELHRLNTTATRIWEWCDGVTSVDDVADRLATEADVERAVVARDVAAYLAQLEANGLVNRG